MARSSDEAPSIHLRLLRGDHKFPLREQSPKDDTKFDTQNTLSFQPKLARCQTSEQQLLMFALLDTQWTQIAKDDTFLGDTPRGPAVKTTTLQVRSNVQEEPEALVVDHGQ